jgi:SAM-dependent methyltransferase
VKPILDMCCGSKMFHFDKNNPNVEYCDIRKGIYTNLDRGNPRITEVNPDHLVDFRSLPFENDSFYQVIFDPPHLLHAGEHSWLNAKYGQLNQVSWEDDLRAGFLEAWRVLKPNGTLIFKWNDIDIPLAKLKPLFPAQPIFGQKRPKIKNGKYSHWLVFMKYKDNLGEIIE